MSRSAFPFFKGLGLLFAILVGIGIAVLGWYDNSDWINIAFYQLASTALVLWGWYHFSIKWIHNDLKEIRPSDVAKYYGVTSNSKDGRRMSRTMQRMAEQFEILKGSKYGTYIYTKPKDIGNFL